MNIALLLGSLMLLAAPVGQGQELRISLDAYQDPLARARTLYAAAAYEEALTSLPAMPEAGQEDDVDRYRTLCLLALGRTAEAERALERALTRDPGFRMLEGEVSPRVIEFFREVRRRVLPIRAESLYARARSDFENRDYGSAVETFTTVLDLLSDPEVASVGKLADLRLVAEEFRKLARERLPAEPMSSVTDPGEVAFDRAASERIYTRLSTNVKPPVEIERDLPPWHPPRDQEWRTFRGVIEVTVDRNGRVESARMLERIATFYDAALVEAARKWRFEPARRSGVPVRFRHHIEVVLRPAS
jgi:TonB family protein